MDCMKFETSSPKAEMDYMKFEINLISASNLEDVNVFRNMKVYARVSLGGNAKTEKRTPVDKHGKRNPAWNFSSIYTINKSAIIHDGTMLIIKLYSKQCLKNRYIGEVHVSLKELFKRARSRRGSRTVSYPVKRGSADSMGMLNFSYRFMDTINDEVSSLWERTLHDIAMALLVVSLKHILGIDIKVPI